MAVENKNRGPKMIEDDPATDKHGATRPEAFKTAGAAGPAGGPARIGAATPKSAAAESATPESAMAEAAATAPEDPALHFLDPALARYLLDRLKGVASVTVRTVGDEDPAGAEVLAFLRAEGFATEFQHVERMVPPPLLPLAVRYQGKSAIVTVATGAAA